MTWLTMDNEHTRQEIVKCVVVGDTAVGKTRLICARACNAYLTLSQVLSTHIPTVWAIDQYRIHKEVLRRSWKVVDGVNVSLRLWDTFGDHEKDRRFAYGRSDVVLLCFSVSNRLSLRNCKTKWYPEIRHYCPHAPIVLVGCKNDLRHIYRDESFLELCREKSPFVRLLREGDMTTREQGRQVAIEIGADYYEASVLTQYGVDEVFENAMRVALISRRHQRFWVKSLKNVRTPMLQMPYCPPRPPLPKLLVQESTFDCDILTLLENCYFADVKLLAGHSEFLAHKVILAAGSSYFHQIFISSLVVNTCESTEVETLTAFQWLSPSTMQGLLRFLYSGTLDPNMHIDLAELLEASKIANIAELMILLKNIQNQEDYMSGEGQKKYLRKLQGNIRKMCLQAELFADITFKVDDGKCLAHRSILMARCDVMEAMFGGDFKESSAKVVQFPGVSMQTFKSFLVYLYTDCVDESINLDNCLALLELANRLCLPHLVSLVESHISEELTEMSSNVADLTQYLFKLLEPCQVHNAEQLSEFCQYYIIINYQDIAANSPKLLRTLHPENQAYLNKNRWPPLHYLKEYDFYERCVREQELRRKPPKLVQWKNVTKSVNGCLWFWGKSKETTCSTSQALVT